MNWLSTPTERALPRANIALRTWSLASFFQPCNGRKRSDAFGCRCATNLISR
jgi:hypothetical protein